MAPGFMLQMGFSFFIVESILRFTSTFVDICYVASWAFGFLSRSKRPPLDILKFLVTTLSNQYNKVAFVWVDKDGTLSRYSEYMKTCHNMNSIVQTIGVYASSINGKIESPIKTRSNITRAIILNSSHKKELWFFAY